MTVWRLAQSARKCSGIRAKRPTPPSFSGCARDVSARAGGSARARGRRIIKLLILLFTCTFCYVLHVGFVVSVGLLFSKPRRGLLRGVVNLAFAKSDWSIRT